MNVFLLFNLRSLIQKVQWGENQKQKAAQMSECVEWQFQDQFGQKVPFDPSSNLILEEAFQKKDTVMLKINGELYRANAVQRKALSATSQKEIELFRMDKKGERGCRRSWFDQKTQPH